MAEIVLEYKARGCFASFHQRDTRFSAMVAHRRCGKTVACINDIHERALYTQKKDARYAYIAPFYSQAKDIAWDYLKSATKDTAVKVLESSLQVDLFNGSRIRLYGADNPNTLRGLYFDGVILDEYGDCRPSLWGEVILPTLADRRGWAVFIGTPKGKNHFYQIYKHAIKEHWYHSSLPVSETNLLSADDLLEIRASGMTDDQYLQEFECSFDAAVIGTYYAHMIAEMERSQKIGTDPIYAYDPNLQVQIATDLGINDSTAMWFWQERPEGQIAIVDYHEADGEYLDEYWIPLLQAKGYDYAQIWLPHDAKAKTLRTRRTTVEQVVEAFGVDKVTVQPRLDIQDGINAARYILPSCTFDTSGSSQGIRVQEGVEALRAYKRSFNELTKQFSNTPFHDWSSNGADAFRGLALVAKQRTIQTHKPKDVQAWEDLCKPVEYSLNDIWSTGPTFNLRRHGRTRIR